MKGITQADINASFIDAEDFSHDQGIADVFMSSYRRGIETGPDTMLLSYSADRWVESPVMTGPEANEKYNLKDTPIAYGDDESVKDISARMAADAHFKARDHQDITAQIEKDQGVMTWMVQAAGGLLAGVTSPINLVTGMGFAMAAKKFGAWAGYGFLQASAESTIGQTVAREAVENFAGVLTTDLAVIPLGEEVIRQNVSVEQRVFNILGGSILGTVMGTGISRAVKPKAGAPDVKVDAEPEVKASPEAQAEANDARVSANRITNAHGSNSEKLVSEGTQKMILDDMQGKKPNPDHVFKRAEIEQYTPRHDQVEHQHVELSNDDLPSRSFFVSKDSKAQEFNTISDKGDGVLVVGEDFNSAHNSASNIQGTKAGKVYEAKISSSRDFMLETEFPKYKTDFVKNFKRASKLDNVNKYVDQAAKESDTVTDFVDNLHTLIEDHKDVPNLNNVANKALKDIGFDGHHFTHTSKHLDKPVTQNAIAIFDGHNKIGPVPKESTLGKAKRDEGGDYVFKNEAGDTAYTITKAGHKTWRVLEGEAFDGKWHKDFVTLRDAKAEVAKISKPQKPKVVIGEGTDTVKFNNKHPEAANINNKLVAHEKAENDRLASYESDQDFDQRALDELNATETVIPEGHDPIADLEAELGRPIKEAVEEEGLKELAPHVEALDSPNKFREGLEAIKKCLK